MDSSSYVCTVRRPCIVEQDNGLAYLADSDVWFSGNHQQNPESCSKLRNNSFSKRRGSFRSLSSFNSTSSSSSSSPRSSSSVRLYDARCEEHQLPHFLESCSLCKKPIGKNKDIFMYRGDTPFCSEECRQEQIEIDEAKEKNWNLSSMKAMRKDQQKSTPNNTRNYQVRTSTVAAAY